MTQTMQYERKADGSIVIGLFNKVEDGENELVKSVVYDCTQLPEAIQLTGLAYGVSKVCAERTSEISPSLDKLEAIQEVWDALAEGNWERERKKGAGPTVRIEVEALANLRKISVKQAQVLIKKYDEAAREKIFANPAVQAEVKKLEAKAAKVDDDMNLDDLLGDDIPSDKEAAA